jgi:serine/threonine-protein kinase
MRSQEGPPREPGALVGGWRIDALLDDGATSLTYRVTEVDGGRAGVLRLLTIKDPAFAERLRRNAAALTGDPAKRKVDPSDAPTRSDHLVPVLAVVEHQGFTGVVSAWIDGPDLGAWAQTDAPLAHRLALFQDVIAGLDQAHRANLVHRNLKPVKIRVSMVPGEPVRAYLEDFLLSRVDLPSDGALTALGVTFGTPQYMSPEQFHGAADVTARGDLFSAGCVLYELATRERAFDGGSIRDVYMAIIDGEYTDPQQVAPELPDALATLIRDLLEPATEDRPASAAEVLARLRAEPLASLVERPIAPMKPAASPASRA